MQQIQDKICQFSPITLQEMEGVKLMDRVDVKYILPLHLLPHILTDALPHYRILEINQERLCKYETLYYDTPTFDLYHAHQAGKLNRYKVRFRNYVGSELSFFEVKHQNNKGRTIKKRIKQPNQIENKLPIVQADFLQSITPLQADNLQANIWVYYKRLTLVHKTNTERLTIDLNLSFEHQTKNASYSNIVVAEVKQERAGASPIIDIFKNYGLRSGSISKYCLGIMSIFDGIKSNRFKSKFLHLQKFNE